MSLNVAENSAGPEPKWKANLEKARAVRAANAAARKGAEGGMYDEAIDRDRGPATAVIDEVRPHDPIAERLAQRVIPRPPVERGTPLSGRAKQGLQIQKASKGLVKDVSAIHEAGGDGMPDGSQGTVTHHTVPRLRLYRPVPQGYYVPAAIPMNNALNCLDAGYLEACPDCGTTNCGPDPNTCTGRAAIPYRTCPVAGCNEGRGKRIYDNPLLGREGSEPGEGEIVDDSFAASTPSQRTAALMTLHILSCHKDAAALYNLQAPTWMNREIHSLDDMATMPGRRG